LGTLRGDVRHHVRRVDHASLSRRPRPPCLHDVVSEHSVCAPTCCPSPTLVWFAGQEADNFRACSQWFHGSGPMLAVDMFEIVPPCRRSTNITTRVHIESGLREQSSIIDRQRGLLFNPVDCTGVRMKALLDPGASTVPSPAIRHDDRGRFFSPAPFKSPVKPRRQCAGGGVSSSAREFSLWGPRRPAGLCAAPRRCWVGVGGLEFSFGFFELGTPMSSARSVPLSVPG